MHGKMSVMRDTRILGRIAFSLRAKLNSGRK